MLNNPWVALYESFAARAFGGNVAGVVVSANPLEEAVMQGVASDLLAPTTGFVSLASISSHNVATRFYTPTQEIDACGHVTIAVAQALTDLDLIPDADPRSIVCAGGTFRITRSGGDWSMFQTIQQQPQPAPVALDDVAAVLGRTPVGVSIAGTGLLHLFVEFASISDLSNIDLNYDRLAALGTTVGVDTIAIFARLDGHTVRLRDLTAPIGVLEEPASGTTSGALGILLGAPSLSVQQGFEMGRPSLIHVEVDTSGVTVSGTTRRVMSGHLDQIGT